MTRLPVAIDGRPLQTKPLGGVGRYLTGTIPLLARQFEVSVLTDARASPPMVHLANDIQVVELAAPAALPGLAWLDLAVAPWLRRFDGVFHGSFNVVPLSTRRPFVLTVHDLAPQLHSEDFRLVTRAAWRLNMRIGVRRARVVTTVSQFVKREILSYFPLDPDQVLVAPVGLDPKFNPERTVDAPDLARSLGISPPYIVALGGASRRGLPVAIEAWRRANRELEKRLTLVVVGEPNLRSAQGLVSVGSPDDESWPTLLAGAQALCYPTRYEGFGLPPLEAMASGTPVVCGRLASLPEVLGDAACWVDVPSSHQVGAVLARLLDDPAWHAERRAAGLAQARAAVTWTETAAILAEAYQCAGS